MKKLHLACGSVILPGWDNLDTTPQVDGAIACDLTQPLPFESDSIDYIFIERYIEHLTKEEGKTFLTECLRILKPEGKLRLTTLDLKVLAQAYVDDRYDYWNDIGWNPTSGCTMLNEGMRQWGHKFIYDFNTLQKTLHEVGFTQLTRQHWHQSQTSELANLEIRPYRSELIIEVSKPVPVAAKLPVISVIMASYNHASFIRESILSVLNQTYRNLELVIIDDGSTDNSVAVIQEVIQEVNDPRLIFLPPSKNEGACIATNRAVRAARGQYIAIINSDDFFHPEKLEKQLTYLEQYPTLGAVFTLPEFVNENSEVIPPESFMNGLGQIFYQNNRSRLEWMQFFLTGGNCLCHPTVLLRKDIYYHIGFLDERMRYLPDFHFWIRLIKHYDIFILPEKLFYYRELSHGRNESAPGGLGDIARLWEHYECCREMQSFPEEFWTHYIAAQGINFKIDSREYFARNFVFAHFAFKFPGQTHLLTAETTLNPVLPANGAGIDGDIYKTYTAIKQAYHFSIHASGTDAMSAFKHILTTPEPTTVVPESQAAPAPKTPSDTKEMVVKSEKGSKIKFSFKIR